MRLRLGPETVLTALFAGGLVWFISGDISDRMSKREAYKVVSELGGQVRSLPCWPFGDELVITFQNSTFSIEDLGRLAILTSLTPHNSVKLIFRNTSLGKDDVMNLKQTLPKIAVQRVVDGNPVINRDAGPVGMETEAP